MIRELPPPSYLDGVLLPDAVGDGGSLFLRNTAELFEKRMLFADGDKDRRMFYELGLRVRNQAITL